MIHGPMGVSVNKGAYSVIRHNSVYLAWSDIHNFHRSLLFVMRAFLSGVGGDLPSRINRLRQ